MSELAKYTILAVVGAASALAGHSLGNRIHGARFFQIVVRSVVESLVLMPGVLTLGFFLSRAASSDFTELVRVPVAFFVPYVGARIAAVVHARGRRAVRAHALPFDHWIDLLSRDRTAAETFLRGYLKDYERRVPDPLSDLRAVFVSIERRHAGNPVLATALRELRREIDRLESLHA